jgi:hypothetical protein
VFKNFGHKYTVNGRECLGVTTVLGQLAKPALIPWAVKMTVDYLQSTMKPGESYDEVQIQKMLEEAKKAHRQKKDDAANFGTMVHEWIESYIKGFNPEPPVNPQMQIAIASFLNWVKNNNVTFISSERPVYSKKYNYAGTCDFICEMNGKRYVGDIKTSNGIYNEYLMQVAAYRFALQEEDPNTVYDGMLIIRVPKDEGEIEVKPFNNYKENAEAFLHTLKVYEHLRSLDLLNKGEKQSKGGVN